MITDDLSWLSPASRSTRVCTDRSIILMSDMDTSCCLEKGFLQEWQSGMPMPYCALTSESCAPCFVASVVTPCCWQHLPTMWDVERWWKAGCMPRCEVATETSIVIMWTSKGGTERQCLPSSEEEKWSICSCLLHRIRFYKIGQSFWLGAVLCSLQASQIRAKTVSLPLSFPLLGSWFLRHHQIFESFFVLK